MRNAVDIPQFITQVERLCYSVISRCDKSLRRAVSDSSNFHMEDEYFFQLKSAGLKKILQLSILHWYLPTEISVLLRLDIEKRIEDFEFADRLLCEQFLHSKDEMINFLINTNRWHSRDFFGNILTENLSVLETLRVQPRLWQRRKAKIPQRKRGYTDKGSRALVHADNPNKYINFSLEMRIEEELRRQQEDTRSFLRGLLI